jgi:hypothetical protein
MFFSGFTLKDAGAVSAAKQLACDVIKSRHNCLKHVCITVESRVVPDVNNFACHQWFEIQGPPPSACKTVIWLHFASAFICLTSVFYTVTYIWHNSSARTKKAFKWWRSTRIRPCTSDELCCLALYTPSWKWHRCPEIGTSSVYWNQLSRFYLRTEIESRLRNVVFWNINRTF